jgi:hypothetical protein
LINRIFIYRYIKPTKEKGPDSSICYGYGTSSNVVFPHECDASGWHCYDGTAFSKETDIVATLANPLVPLPPAVVEMKASKNTALEEDRTRDSKPGSIIVKGATADRAKFLNGVFEPTDEVCNGMPVYQKKGDPGTWLEMVKTNAGCWRW